ncbi:AfsR/SARP family transcriptional regulator [Pseudonocardia sp. TRM90224]|uniref:AfsR/SARP family transcriptional regulator n=1 Tax=Pseudonocardia sp. TRM90224 TaxID=2812678 RepID=UPI001E4C0E21|nr:BTAD domain-containing putative transcriptional regulator [Pseudonocardia sp. TRM90224]
MIVEQGLGAVIDRAAVAQMDVLVLGPTRISVDGQDVVLRRPLERALLVRLALAGGRAVHESLLTADLWPEGDSGAARRRLRVNISRLRQALGPWATLLEHTSGGYRLQGGQVPDRLAASLATMRIGDAVRAGRPAEVLDIATTVLGQWRGYALQDLRHVPFAAAEARSLDERHLELTVHRLTALLSLGAAEMIINELAGLAAVHPLNERVHTLLAHALYCAGRQADALGSLRTLRKALVDVAGLDPAPGTSQLECRILRHDPTLHPQSVA